MTTLKPSFFNHKGLCGLTNLGNTCYMNSIIQCISNTLPLTTYILTNRYLPDYNDTRQQHIIIREWHRLLRGIWDKNVIIEPVSFNKSIQQLALLSDNKQFVAYKQNDASEFLIFMLDNMHLALCKPVLIQINGKPKNIRDKMAIKAMEAWKTYFKNEYSVFVELFYAQLCSSSKCDTCNNTSNTYDPYNCLVLPLNKTTRTLYDCFDEFTKQETLDLDTEWKCEKCKDIRVCKKQCLLWSSPKYLICILKRFNNNSAKITSLINFPLTKLDLTKYCAGYDKTNSVYDLYAITNHTGGTGGGHYYAYCKNMDGHWYCYNDTHVSVVTDTSKLISQDAYCLFYKKIIKSTQQ